MPFVAEDFLNGIGLDWHAPVSQCRIGRGEFEQPRLVGAKCEVACFAREVGTDAKPPRHVSDCAQVARSQPHGRSVRRPGQGAP